MARYRQPQKSSNSFSPTALVEPDEDNISLTSTVAEERENDEYEVEDILAEDIHHGMKYYLILWANYPLEESTWEPRSHISAGILRRWERIKKKQQRGEVEAFDIASFQRAKENYDAARRDRHRRRNAKRGRLNLPLTKPFHDEDEDLEELWNEEVDTEAREDEDLEDQGGEEVNTEMRDDAHEDPVGKTSQGMADDQQQMTREYEDSNDVAMAESRYDGLHDLVGMASQVMFEEPGNQQITATEHSGEEAVTESRKDDHYGRVGEKAAREPVDQQQIPRESTKDSQILASDTEEDGHHCAAGEPSQEIVKDPQHMIRESTEESGKRPVTESSEDADNDLDEQVATEPVDEHQASNQSTENSSDEASSDTREDAHHELAIESDQEMDEEPIDQRPMTRESSDSSSEEAVEVDVLDDMACSPRATPRPSPKQRIFKVVLQPLSAEQTHRRVSDPQSTNISGRPDAPLKLTVDTSTAVSSERRSRLVSTSPHAEPPSVTGYQGTARKPGHKSPNTSIGGRAEIPGGISAIGNPLHAAAVARGTAPGRSLQSAGRQPSTAKKNKATRNIFAGGTTRKLRANLAHSMSDPSRDPKMFSKLRYRGLAQKRSRDTEDRPPDLASLAGNLFDISKGPSDRGESTQVSPTEKSPGSNTFRSDLNDDLRARKKAKSVRFLEGDIAHITAEPMSIESPDQGHDALGNDVGEPPFVNSKGVGETQTVGKMLQVGLNPNTIAVTFAGIPRRSDDGWLRNFLQHETLKCNYTCLANTLGMQIKHISVKSLCTGTVATEDSNSHIINRIASNLRLGPLGLFSCHDNLSLVIYPTRCDEWNWVTESFGHKPEHEGELKYFVFIMKAHLELFLRPIGTMGNSNPVEVSTSSIREFLVRRIFKLNYLDLVPESFSEKIHRHNFFLAFPPSKVELLQAFYHWLRDCKPDCHIYTSHHAGGWLAFRAAVDKRPGVVIVHEMAIPALRQFPGLSRYLIFKHDIYWGIAEPTRPQPIYPSLSETLAPGRMSLTQLFPNNTVVLVTPSFLQSEPKRTRELLEWAYDGWKRSRTLQLVCAWNLPEYLQEMALEDRRAEHNSRDTTDKYLMEQSKGQREEDYKNRSRSLEIATQLHYLREAANLAGSAIDEEHGILIYVQRCVDPNDEQSLVNWFGWWSTVHMHRYRKFHVIGSSTSMVEKGSKRGRRLIKIPSYTRSTLKDPYGIKETSRSAADALASHRQYTKHTSLPSRRTAPWIYQSNLVKSEKPDEFRSRLEPLSKPSRYAGWVLYKFPVSWTDSAMATHYDDRLETFKTMTRWIAFPFPFTDGSAGYRRFNTYLGFFYTPTTEWDPQNPPKDIQPRRHPWLAIYRPVNQAKEPYEKLELIIWDVASGKRYPSSRGPKEADLIYCQRYLIKRMREHAINPRSRLDRVWLGGFRPTTGAKSKHPIDTTLEYLSSVCDDIRTHIPAHETLLSQLGYRRVQMITDPAPSPEHHSSVDTEKIMIDEGTDGEDSRMIFHPPRHQNDRPPALTNQLYEQSILARTSSPTARTMHFQFTPTVEWYRKQVEEGQGFEHLNVGPWETIFDRFKIGSRAATTHRPSSSREGDQASNRSD
jgi:chromo domain-containing protein 1